KRSLWFALSLLGSGLALLAQIDNFSSETTALFGGMLVFDPLAQVSSIIIIAITFLTVLVSYPYLEEQSIHFSEFYALLLMGSLGMLWMVSSKDLLTIFLALETFSISLYVLVGFDKANIRSREAALKFFLLSAFASGFLL